MNTDQNTEYKAQNTNEYLKSYQLVINLYIKYIISHIHTYAHTYRKKEMELAVTKPTFDVIDIKQLVFDVIDIKAKNNKNKDNQYEPQLQLQLQLTWWNGLLLTGVRSQYTFKICQYQPQNNSSKWSFNLIHELEYTVNSNRPFYFVSNSQYLVVFDNEFIIDIYINSGDSEGTRKYRVNKSVPQLRDYNNPTVIDNYFTFKTTEGNLGLRIVVDLVSMISDDPEVEAVADIYKFKDNIFLGIYEDKIYFRDYKNPIIQSIDLITKRIDTIDFMQKHIVTFENVCLIAGHNLLVCYGKYWKGSDDRLGHRPNMDEIDQLAKNKITTLSYYVAVYSITKKCQLWRIMRPDLTLPVAVNYVGLQYLMISFARIENAKPIVERTVVDMYLGHGPKRIDDLIASDKQLVTIKNIKEPLESNVEQLSTTVIIGDNMSFYY